MRLDVGLQQRLSQQLRLAPQIIQSIEILQLPAMDLKELIEKELQENEMLEVAEAPSDPLSEAAPAAAPADDDNDDEADRVFDRLAALAEADRAPRGSRAAAEEASDRKWEALQNAAAPSESLADHLMEQLELLELRPEVRAVAEHIVWNLNDAGLLPYTLEEVVAGMDEPQALDVAEEALKAVQSLEPAGVGARTLTEALLLQVPDEDPDAERKRRLLRDHLDDLNRNKIPRIAHALGCSIEDVYALLEDLKKLNPRPGAAWSSTPVRHVLPDAVVEWAEDDYEVRLVDDHLPRLALAHSPLVRQLLRDARSDPKLKEYVKRKVDAAKWLIEAVTQRQNTLSRVAREIVQRQRDYLDFGLSHLRPLKMQEVADALGIHVSTVSRAISDKWVQTHRGIVPFKYFFTGGTENEEGGVESRASVRERVKEIIDAEDKANPLSDDDVADRLSKAHGLAIARRTVTKYRKALRIPSSRQRRVWSGG
jgi:RNA polymerase sigma-54 factor